MRVKIKSAPRKAKNGASLEPLTSDMSLFHGPSHQNNGIPYEGVEVEGGEPLYKALDGSEIIFGNMTTPGTNKKFKDVAQLLAKKEQRVDKLIDKGTDLVNNFSPDDPWDELKFNAGKAMMTGGIQKKQELKQNKEHLATLQQALLDISSEMGADPQALSKGKMQKAKYGMRLENGGDKKPSMATRHNNPGNIKFGAFAKKFGAVQGEPAQDGGYFAKFPDVQTGLKALKGLLKTDGYKNLSVDEAVKRWTNGTGYSVNYKDLKTKKVKDLSGEDFDKLVNTITTGEDGKYYTSDNKETTPVASTPVKPFDPIGTYTAGNPKTHPQRTVTPGDYNLDVTPLSKKSIPSNAKGLDFYQILPELAAYAQNNVEPVAMQQYNPQLFQKTNVSFQDRLNQNNTSFNALQKVLGDNPAALSTLAGQKYNADNQVMADEFRTNQQIEQDITNKNIALLNDAQLKNLQLSDQQYVRQSQAKSNTKALNNTILNSITSKIAQTQARNQALKYYETMTDYRFNPETGQMDYMGAPGGEYIRVDGADNTNSGDTRVTVNKDANGNVKSTRETTASPLDTEKKQFQNYIMRRDDSLNNPVLFPWQRKKENGGTIQQMFKKR